MVPCETASASAAAVPGITAAFSFHSDLPAGVKLQLFELAMAIHRQLRTRYETTR
jgi:hypothetical protein